MSPSAFGLLALIPLMVGPLPHEARTLTVGLCNGGTITIPIGDGEKQGPERDCHSMACHAGNTREKAKRPGGPTPI